MKSLYTCLSAIAFLILYINGNSQNLCFDPANDNRYETSGLCMDLGVLDINNDGHLDVIVTGGSETSIHIGNGDGTFEPYYTSQPGTNWDIEFADIDSDGDLDFYSYGFGGCVVGRNLNNGSFEWAGSLGVTLQNNQMSEMSIGNVLGNGGFDIVFNDQGADLVYIMDTDNFGIPFTSTSISVIDNPLNVKVGNLNGDSNMDIVVSSGVLEDIGIYLSNGDGTFTEIIEHAGTPVGSGYGTIEIADIDGDNDNDILVGGMTVTYVLQNDGLANFTSLPDVFMGSYSQGFVTGDWDNDNDLAWANHSGGGVTINLNNGDGTFPSQGNAFFSSGNQSEELAAGDFDEDGILDLAVANGFFENFAFLKGNGDGKFGSLALLTGYGASGFCAADFDNDGDQDIVATNYYAPSSMSFNKNNGDGSFEDSQFIPTVGNAGACVAGYFNNDLNADVAIHSDNGFSIHYGNGDGTFDNYITFPSANIGEGGDRTICTGDFNGDGNSDLAGSRVAANNVAVVYGDGNGNFSAPDIYEDGIQYARTIIAAHLNNDTYEDIVITSNSADEVFVYFGTAAENLSSPLVLTAAGAPEGVTAFDANEDGANDLFVVCPNANKLYMFPGNNDQTFEAYVQFDTPGASNPTKGAHADINNDGNEDFVCALYQSDVIAVMFGHGDGTFQPAVNYGVDRRPIDVLVADFNNDEAIDLASLNSSVNNVSVVLNNSAFVSADGELAFCEGEDVVLTANESYSYDWNNGEETQSITVTEPGEYYCIMTNQSGTCMLVTPNVLVEVFQSQTVSLDLDSTVVCNNAGSFYLSGGSPFGGQFSGTGVNANQFDPSSAGEGTYTIIYTYEDAGGCTNSSASDEITVVICIGVDELEEAINIYPTCTNGLINIACPQNSIATLYDNSGRVLIVHSLNRQQNQIHLDDYSDGIYFVKIEHTDQVMMAKLILRK